MTAKRLWRRLRGLFGSRQGLCALLFLGCLAFGGYTALFGSLRNAQACAGYVGAQVEKLGKTDPAIPHRYRVSRRTNVTGMEPEETALERLAALAAKAEGAVDDALRDEPCFIDLYGQTQKWLGRTNVEDVDPAYAVARTASGTLTFVGNETADPAAQAADLKRCQIAVEEMGATFLYLQVPGKLEPGAEGLPYGVEDATNASADALLSALDEAEVEYIDFRETLAQANGEWSDWFYTTDHHWNQDGAFLAFQALAQRLEQCYPRQEPEEETDETDETEETDGETEPQEPEEEPEPFDLDYRLTERTWYERTTLEDFFLGSQGKRVGTRYAGVDDFTLWVPKFPTLLHYNAPAAGVDRYGSMTETVLFPEQVEEKDYFDATAYTYYAGGDYPISWITNYYNPDGPRVVLIRDSYACALTPYLALACSELVTIDPRYFTGDVLTYISWAQPDVVLVMFSGGMIRGQSGMKFLSQPAAPGKGSDLRWEEPLRGQEQGQE